MPNALTLTSCKASTAALPALRDRVLRLGEWRAPCYEINRPELDFEALGYKALDVPTLVSTFEFLQNTAPIVIHFPPNLLGHFAVDTHYRNQFETGTSRGALSSHSRSKWENNMFGNAYDQAAPSERVKYGALNFSGDYRGVVSAQHYGSCFMVLEEKVRVRTTFTVGTAMKSVQSLGMPYGMSTCDHFAHALTHFTDEELLLLIKVITK